MDNTLKFIAEIKETKQSKAISLDNVYSVKFVTDDSRVLDLGKLSPDTLVVVTVTISNNDRR